MEINRGRGYLFQLRIYCQNASRIPNFYDKHFPFSKSLSRSSFLRPVIIFSDSAKSMNMYTANVYRYLQGLCRGFSAISAGKPCNIYRLQGDCREIAGKICKCYGVFPADIVEKLFNHPINPCKHLQFVKPV